MRPLSAVVMAPFDSRLKNLTESACSSLRAALAHNYLLVRRYTRRGVTAPVLQLLRQSLPARRLPARAPFAQPPPQRAPYHRTPPPRLRKRPSTSVCIRHSASISPSPSRHTLHPIACAAPPPSSQTIPSPHVSRRFFSTVHQPQLYLPQPPRVLIPQPPPFLVATAHTRRIAAICFIHLSPVLLRSLLHTQSHYPHITYFQSVRPFIALCSANHSIIHTVLYIYIGIPSCLCLSNSFSQLNPARVLNHLQSTSMYEG